jgi:hypothetical protein
MSGNAKNDLMALLNLLKSKSESSSLEPKIGMQRIIELMRAQGHPFNYAIFTQLAQDPSISNLIADYNKDQLTIDAEGVKVEQPKKLDVQPDEADEFEQQRDTVGDMAKRALKRRG